MKTVAIRNPSRIRGASLMELTLAMFLILVIAGAIVGLVSQQVSFLRIVRSFSFLRDEAPAVNLMVARILNQADLYRIYTSRQAAFDGGTAVNSGGRAVWFRFRNPDGTFDQSVIAFESGGDGPQLNYYHRPPGGVWPNSPSWTISSRVAAVAFADTSGMLELALSGPAGEQIIYGGALE